MMNFFLELFEDVRRLELLEFHRASVTRCVCLRFIDGLTLFLTLTGIKQPQ
jgi:hypothetical protein